VPYPSAACDDARMPGFHHLWIVEAELEVRNPTGDDPRCERLFEALSKYAGEETSPYPTQAARDDDGWVEVTFPVWAPTRWAAIASGAAVLAESCSGSGLDVGVTRLTAGESSEELTRYRERTRELEATR
jgi:hypothetical protein